MADDTIAGGQTERPIARHLNAARREGNFPRLYLALALEQNRLHGLVNVGTVR